MQFFKLEIRSIWANSGPDRPSATYNKKFLLSKTGALLALELLLFFTGSLEEVPPVKVQAQIKATSVTKCMRQ